jgi:FixJ family two-component response regulator
MRAGVVQRSYFVLNCLSLHVDETAPRGVPVDLGIDQGPEKIVADSSLISIVDDDRPLRESMRRLLRSLGYTVEVFPSAADFLASPRLGETACLIADVHMPGMNGDDLYRSVVNTGRKIPTILVTAYPDDDVRDRALKDGVACYLHKPIDKDQLVDCIRLSLSPRGSS